MRMKNFRRDVQRRAGAELLAQQDGVLHSNDVAEHPLMVAAHPHLIAESRDTYRRLNARAMNADAVGLGLQLMPDGLPGRGRRWTALPRM